MAISAIASLPARSPITAIRAVPAAPESAMLRQWSSGGRYFAAAGRRMPPLQVRWRRCARMTRFPPQRWNRHRRSRQYPGLASERLVRRSCEMPGSWQPPNHRSGPAGAWILGRNGHGWCRQDRSRCACSSWIPIAATAETFAIVNRIKPDSWCSRGFEIDLLAPGYFVGYACATSGLLKSAY